MSTTIPAGYGQPELTATLDATALAAFPMWIGRTADFFRAECLANHPHPEHVSAVMTAALVGGGMAHKEAEGTVSRLSFHTNASGPLLNSYVLTVVSEALGV